MQRTAFQIGLFLTAASTLMYEIVLTRLLSVISWYYLAFVSVSMAMFGMTVGALAVQLKPALFGPEQIPRRLAQSCAAMAVSTPLALVMMLAIPVDLSLSAQVLFSFLLFSAVIATPFFFSGVAVCLSLTRSPIPIGRTYFVDLAGAAAGCYLAIVTLSLTDGPSVMFLISALLFVSAAAYATHAGETRWRTRAWLGAVGMLALAALNSATLYGIQPIWSKGRIDRRTGLLAEIWNPISKVRAMQPHAGPPLMWGPSARMPVIERESISLNIDNDAATSILRFRSDLREFDFLRYDVTSLAAQLRPGGEAAIIGVGGGRDVLNAAVNGFRSIVGIEVNSAIVDLCARRLDWFSGFSKIPGLEIHVDEGRSYLTRSGRKFDLIQASLVDTWAATSAGAMTLSENSLYTVEGWQVFYRHLKPGGLVSFSRWQDTAQTPRLFSVAWAMLLAEGVADPSPHIALVGSGSVATLLVSNQPLSAIDLARLRAIVEEMDFHFLFLPGSSTVAPELRAIASARSLDQLNGLRESGYFDYSPAYDASPFFFNALRLRNVPQVLRNRGLAEGNLQALLFVLGFMLAAMLLVLLTVVLPLAWRARLDRTSQQAQRAPAGAIVYFIAIGLGFLLVEIAMMQQLSILLGHPIYSMAVVLAGVILAAGVGSLASERLRFSSSLASRGPAFIAALVVLAYATAVVPAIHAAVAGVLWQRIALSLALVAPPGFVMGFCFPVGLRWMVKLGQEANLPWMWALNGAASVLASFLAILISMETSITVSALTGAGCYALAAIALPHRAAVTAAGELQRDELASAEGKDVLADVSQRIAGTE